MQPPKPPPPPNRSGFSPTVSAASSGAMRTVPPHIPPARSSVIPWVCLGMSLFVFGIVAVAIIWRVASTDGTNKDFATAPPTNEEPESISAQNTTGQPAPIENLQTAVASNNPSVDESQSPIDGASKPTGSDNPRGVEAPTIPASISVSPRNQPVVQETSTATDPPAVFADLRLRKFELELPGRGVTRDATEAKLAALPLTEGETLQLAVSGDAAAGIKLVRSTVDANEWMVLKQARDAFGGQEEVALGKFLHREGELRFQWDVGAPGWSKPGSLQFAQLVVTVGKQSQLCQLWQPVVVNPTRINPQAATTAEIPLPGEFIDRPQTFRVQFQFAGTSQPELPSAVVAIGETAKITIGDSEANGVDAELKLTPGNSRSSLQVRLFASPPTLGKDGEIRRVRQEISPAVVQIHVRQGRAKDPKKRESEIDKLQKQVSNLQKQVSNRETAMSGAMLAVRERYQEEITSLNQQIDAMETKLAKLETDRAAMQDLSDKNSAWCEEVGGILKNLEDLAQLRYAIYVDNVPRTVVIETSGFEWKTK